MTIKNIGHSRKVRLLALSGHDNKEYQQMLVRYFPLKMNEFIEK